MRVFRSWCSWFLIFPASLAAQEAYKAQDLKQGAPSSVSPQVSAVLNPAGYRVLDGEGKPLADLWLRKEIPAASKPAGAKGVIQFPFLAEGELLGVVQLLGEVRDYRDQAITRGVYTIRYGLQPVNGDHLGVSPFRDYSMLLPAAKDTTLAIPARKQLDSSSAESAGSSHPAVFFMLSGSAASKVPSMLHDEEKNTWRLVVPLSLTVKGDSAPVVLPVSIILVGVSEAA